MLAMEVTGVENPCTTLQQHVQLILEESYKLGSRT